MTVTAKICGLTTPEAVRAAIDGRASHIGFMFFDKSPRNIAPEDAARLAEPARAAGVRICAVTVDPDDALVDRLTQVLRPDFLQLHGRETPARAQAVRDRSGVGVIKAVQVGDAGDIDRAAAYDQAVDHLMLDARPPPDLDRPGGTGLRFDWTLTQGRRFSRPWFLAGGLDPWNVAEAAALSGAPMVDVSSGVERGPGLKDPTLIASFLDAVRRF